MLLAPYKKGWKCIQSYIVARLVEEELSISQKKADKDNLLKAIKSNCEHTFPALLLELVNKWVLGTDVGSLFLLSRALKSQPIKKCNQIT